MSESRDGGRDASIQTITDAETLLLEILGAPFLSFVLSVPEADVLRRLRDRLPLGSVQEDVLRELIVFLGTLAHEAHDRFSVIYSLGALAQRQQTEELGWALRARVLTGGDIALPTTSDEVGGLLLILVRDLYPLFLLPTPAEEPFRSMGVPSLAATSFRWPEREQLERAVLADDRLARLFPDTAERTGRQGFVYRSTGSGSLLQLIGFGHTLVEGAWRKTLRQAETPSLRQLAEAALEVLELTRRAAAGDELQTPARIAITGVRLPAGMVVDLPWGRLREATDVDRRDAPSDISGLLTTTREDGTQVVVDYAGDIIFELDVPYEIKVTRARTGGALDWPLDIQAHWDFAQKRIETVRLALLLSGEDRLGPIVHSTWQIVEDPLASGQAMRWQDARRLPGISPAALTVDQAEAWGEWATLVDQGRAANIEVAVRRTLQATSERADPTDALVDAVVAWENLVGSRQGEPTLRVSASLSRLLADDDDERAAVYRKVKRIYDLRSNVVHGNRFLDPQEAVGVREEALAITVAAFRILFRDRPELLATCRDSTERSQRLILGS